MHRDARGDHAGVTVAAWAAFAACVAALHPAHGALWPAPSEAER